MACWNQGFGKIVDIYRDWIWKVVGLCGMLGIQGLNEMLGIQEFDALLGIQGLNRVLGI